jgi:hypothetical protein
MDNYTDIDIPHKNSAFLSALISQQEDIDSENDTDTDNDILADKMIEYDDSTVDNIKIFIDDYITSNSIFMCENIKLHDYRKIFLLLTLN